MKNEIYLDSPTLPAVYSSGLWWGVGDGDGCSFTNKGVSNLG